MIRRFIFTGLFTTIINLILNTLAYILVLRDFYRLHPAGSPEFVEQLSRKPEDLIIWAMAATSLGMGFFITLIIKWSGARGFVAGLKSGLLVGFLFWGSVNFGLYASSHMFSLASVFVDLLCSGTAMALSCAGAAMMLKE